jgi:uncharacterized membrane protein YsdA (DUF1294 family)/cold shock CspA family protein
MQLEGQLLEGRLVRWNDDRGFGFIRTEGGKKDVFIHISSLRNMSHRPAVGNVIHFVLRRDEQGRLSAREAVIVGLKAVAAGRKNDRLQRRDYRIDGRPLGGFGWLMMSSAFLFSAWVLIQDRNPVPLLIYTIMSLFTFVTYAIDKKKAIDGNRRMPENVLHLLELFGGWPGGLVAQYKARHKSRKESYQIVFWLIVFLHVLAWADYLLLNGRWIWRPVRTIIGAFLQ